MAITYPNGLPGLSRRRLITVPHTLLLGGGTSLTLTAAQLASLGAFDASTAILGGLIVVPTAFAAPGLSRLTIDLGFSGALSWLISGQRCDSVSSGVALNGTVKTGEFGGVPLIMTIGTIGANMSALTQGSATIYLYHSVAKTDS